MWQSLWHNYGVPVPVLVLFATKSSASGRNWISRWLSTHSLRSEFTYSSVKVYLLWMVLGGSQLPMEPWQAHELNHLKCKRTSGIIKFIYSLLSLQNTGDGSGRLCKSRVSRRRSLKSIEGGGEGKTWLLRGTRGQKRKPYGWIRRIGTVGELSRTHCECSRQMGLIRKVTKHSHTHRARMFIVYLWAAEYLQTL